MKNKWLAVAGVVMLLSVLATVALAGNPMKLMINGQEIKPDVPLQIINGRTMAPVRWIAEALGADVKWDDHANLVLIDSKTSPVFIPKQQVVTLLQEQGENNDYYLEGLSFELVNLDDDDDLEIVAQIDGAVHLGEFFIFKKDLQGDYKLITEQGWKVERCNFKTPLEIEGKKLYEIVTRSGGTGLDIFNVHLVYLEQANFVEAWQGTLFKRDAQFLGSYYKRMGSYQFDAEGKRLYVWETTHQLEDDSETPKGEFKTTTTVYFFDGQKFTPEKTSSYN